MTKNKIILSDPQVLFREGIHFILSGEDDLEVIEETTSNEDALTQINANPPNIAVLGMQNGKLNGPQATRRIKRQAPPVSVILVTDKVDDEQLFSAMQCGASALLSKDTGPEQLLDVIRAVNHGSRPILEAMQTPAIASRVLTAFSETRELNEQIDNLLADLSPRESEILNGIAAGTEKGQVAAGQGIQEEAIDLSLSLVLDKLVANDRARTTIEAAQRSLPSIFGGAMRAGLRSDEFITRAEFEEFKESMIRRLKDFIGEAV